MPSGNCFAIVTDPAQIARDNDLVRSKVELGAAVGICPRPAPGRRAAKDDKTA